MIMRTFKSFAKDVALHGIAGARELMGAPSQFGIRGAYKHRTEALHFDDTPFTDEYQREVYLRAASIARESQARTVYDIGCGSGYKLLNYLGDYETTGFDVPQTLGYLRDRYPNRQWAHAEFSDRSHAPADIVICSDVIEHVPDPDALMGFLLSVSRRWLVLSTPDRGREHPFLSRQLLGPPATHHHMREWTFREFGKYMARFAHVREHKHSNPAHSTQMIVAEVRRQPQ